MEVSDTSESSGTDTAAQRQALAITFKRDTDPLAKYASGFENTDIDPFDLFMTEVIDQRPLAKNTYAQYVLTFRQWRDFMGEQGRHPACPNEEHVKGFAHHELEDKKNHPATVKEKLRKLNEAYEYWQADLIFPHPDDYNPVKVARLKIRFNAPETKEPPRIPLAELREILSS